MKTDGGELARDDEFGLELRWMNKKGCNAVGVLFDNNLKVNGWDEGRLCIEDVELFFPGDEYLCEKEDRSKYCGLE